MEPVIPIVCEPIIANCWKEIDGTDSLFHLHRELGIVLCRFHNICIPKAFLSSHLRIHHQINTPLSTEILSRVNDSNSDILEEFYSRHINNAIPNIKVLEGHFKCSDCHKIYSKRRTLKTHYAIAHAGKTAGEFIKVDCQTLFHHPLHLRYFVVSKDNFEQGISNNEQDVEFGMVPLMEIHKRKQNDYAFQSEEEIEFHREEDFDFQRQDINSNNDQEFESFNNVVKHGQNTPNGHLNSQIMPSTHHGNTGMVVNRNRLSSRIHKWFKTVPA